MEQRGAVLQSVVCQPCNTEAVATVGLRTAADATRAERYMDRQAAAIASMKIKAGSMCKDIQTALDSFITMLAPIANSTVLQRGKEAKAARAAGIAVPQAKVCGAREFAKDFGLSLSTAYKHLKASIERRPCKTRRRGGRCVLDLDEAAHRLRGEGGDSQASTRILPQPPWHQAFTLA